MQTKTVENYISPVFQLYIVKEYQRLKEVENNQYNLEWNVKRVLSKANYTLHTDAVKKYVIPHKADFDKALTKAINYKPNKEKEPSE